MAYSQRLAQARELLSRIEEFGGPDKAWPSRPVANPMLKCRKVPDEVTFLVDWRAGARPEFPDSVRLCEGWGPESGGALRYRWELVN